jgi:nucleotide-binding universal stress UspA family protein
MFHHILAPLDGSRMAESALPAAAFIAERFRADVTLLHVIEHHAPSEVHGEPHLTDPVEADRYLERLKKTAFPEGVATACHVHEVEVENVARSIVEHAGEYRPDLIVMCTHGKSGIRTQLFGSIAQRVIAMGTVPILLIRPGEDESFPPFRCGKILLPLDANPEHERSIPSAVDLTRACGAELRLVMVVPTVGSLPGEWAASGKLLPGATGELLDIAREDAGEYLRRMAETLKDREGIPGDFAVLRGDPAEVIEAAASNYGADVVILGTHGRSGLDAFWSGSIASRVTAHTSVALLLVPV